MSFVLVRQFNPDTNVHNVFWTGADNGDSLVQDTYVSNRQILTNMLSFRITATPSSLTFSGVGTVLIQLPVSSISAVPPGPIHATVWDTDGMIPRQAVSSGIMTGNPTVQLAIDNSSLPAAIVGSSYTASVRINNGGYPPYAFSVTAGHLAPGLTLAPNEGTISGTPSVAGSYTFAVTVRDNTMYSASQNYTLTVNPAAAPPSSSPPTGPAFSDIANSWAQSYIAELAKAGVVSGYPDGTFRPDATVTRVQFAKMLL